MRLHIVRGWYDTYVYVTNMKILRYGLSDGEGLALFALKIADYLNNLLQKCWKTKSRRGVVRRINGFNWSYIAFVEDIIHTCMSHIWRAGVVGFPIVKVWPYLIEKSRNNSSIYNNGDEIQRVVG